MKFIDTHTHMFSDQFNKDSDEVIKRAIDAGVEKMMLPDIDGTTTEAMLQLAAKYPDNCFPMLGLHPCSVKKDFRSELERIGSEHRKGDTKYWAVGEIGMDLYWDKTYIDQQKEAFRFQIELAKELSLPIAIHVRECFEEVLEIVDELNDDQLTGIFHCFSGTLNQANHIIEYGGFMLGLGGVLTFKKAGLDQVVKDIDLKHLILETDSPYLAPAPYRGKRNESSYLLHVAQKLAEVKQVSLKEIAEITTNNALQVFKF